MPINKPLVTERMRVTEKYVPAPNAFFAGLVNACVIELGIAFVLIALGALAWRFFATGVFP